MDWIREKQLEEGPEACYASEAERNEGRQLESVMKAEMGKGGGWGIDYNAEIPFLKKPPLSFYDVTDEETRPPLEQPKFPITVE